MQQEESNNVYNPTENARIVLERRYLQKDSNGELIETPNEMMRRIANAISSVEEKKSAEYSREFYNILVSGMFLPNSPTIMNAGTKTSMLSACFVLDIKDNMENILDVVKEVGIIFKMGGGVGINFSNIRPEGSFIHTTGGYSSGPVSFMKIFDTLTKVIAQGGRRRGALMGLLNINHPDILSFINAKNEAKRLTGFNLSVGVTNAFMKMHNKDPNQVHMVTEPNTGKRRKLLDKKGKSVTIKQIFDLITQKAWESGEPGIIFLDRLQEFNTTPSLKISCVNPCLPGNTPVITPKGLKKFSQIKIGDIIWGKDSWTTVVNKMSSGIKKVYKYTTTAGCFYGTDNHRIFSKGEKVELKDADFIDNLVPKFNMCDYSEDIKSEDIIDGLVIGDGCYYSDKNKPVVLCIGDSDKDYFKSRILNYIHEEYDRKKYRVCTSVSKEELGYTYGRVIPERFVYTQQYKMLGFLLGLFSANGDVLVSKNKTTGKTNYRVSLRATSKKLIDQVQFMLSALGIGSYVTTDKSKKIKFNNGEYKVKESYKLNITRDIRKFYDSIGFLQDYKMGRLFDALNKKDSVKPRKVAYEIKKVELVSEEEVFDITVDNASHSFWAWGFHTSNCGETPLPPLGSCTLGSIDVSKFVNLDESIAYDKLKKVICLAVRFLDNVISVNDYPLAKIGDVANKIRNIGLGVMGFADLLFKMRIPYNSDTAVKVAEDLMGFINETAHSYSEVLGKEKGNFPLFNDSIWKKVYSSHRNSTCTVIAPTGTISKIGNCSSGIEPLFSPIFKHIILDRDEMYEMSPFLKTILSERNIGLSESDMKQIYEEGTIKNISSIPQDIKTFFVCSHDIEPLYHIRMQEAFQKNTDCAVSKTINLPNRISVDAVRTIYDYAFQSKFLKGITVFRDGSRADQPMQIGSSTKKGKRKSEYEWFLDLLTAVEKKDSISPAVKIKQSTPFGTLHVTLVFDKKLNEHEVFAQLGKSGDVVGADLEAICRLSSKLLQSKFKFDDLIKQLTDIGTSLALPTQAGKVVSLPDGLAKALNSYKEIKLEVLNEKTKKASKTHNGDLYKVKCTSCNSGFLIYSEGCCHCDTCEYELC